MVNRNDSKVLILFVIVMLDVSLKKHVLIRPFTVDDPNIKDSNFMYLFDGEYFGVDMLEVEVVLNIHLDRTLFGE